MTHPKMRWLAPLAAFALTACTADEPAASHEAELGEVQPSHTPTVEVPTVEETEPRRADDASRTREQMREVPFPVLLLPDRLSEGAVLTAGTVWYAMSYDAPREITVSIHATNQVHMAIDEAEEAPPPNAEVRGAPAYTGVNEGIRSLTWEAAEVAYVVEVECWDVLDDPRCTEPDFVQQVADELVELER